MAKNNIDLEMLSDFVRKIQSEVDGSRSSNPTDLFGEGIDMSNVPDTGFTPENLKKAIAEQVQAQQAKAKPVEEDLNARSGGLLSEFEDFLRNKIVQPLQRTPIIGSVIPDRAATKTDAEGNVTKLDDQATGILKHIFDNFGSSRAKKGITKALKGSTQEERLVQGFRQIMKQKGVDLPKGSLKTKPARAKLAGTTFKDPQTNLEFTFDESGAIIRI